MPGEKRASPRVIKSRFRMMGQGLIPKEELRHLSEKQIKVFLTEPNPDNWPPELSHLKKYVPEDTVA